MSGRDRSHAALFAVALSGVALGQACSCGANRCSGVTCSANEACDPTDGVCKCGGAVCGPTESCSAVAMACTSQACDQVSCGNGTACDPADGVCKCGGAACAPDELCDPETHSCLGTAACQGVLCSAGTACDPTDGSCKCGGSACAARQSCLDGGCAADPCFGVHCSGEPGNGCYQGVCRCGGSDGPSCDTGQICVPGQKSCQPSELCAGTDCQPGAVCGQSDGLCHCGALAGPVCLGGAVCTLFFGPDGGPWFPGEDGGGPLVGRCLGGDLCANVTCPDGEGCDPGSGACRCGGDAGQPGLTCAAAQICGTLPGAVAPSCLTPCDPFAQPPFAQTPGCPREGDPLDGSVPQGCFYEPAVGEGEVVCEPSGAGTDGTPCQAEGDCAPGYGCFDPPPDQADAGGVTSCRAFCDTFDGGAHGCAIFGRACEGKADLQDDAGLVQVGACQPVSAP